MNRAYIDVYPVGLLDHIKSRRVLYGLRYYLWRRVRAGEWRSVRNYFNGYLAEVSYPPAGLAHTHAGRGWTKRAALSSLGRRLGADNPRPARTLVDAGVTVPEGGAR